LPNLVVAGFSRRSNSFSLRIADNTKSIFKNR
jgi:hypothetical protein